MNIINKAKFSRFLWPVLIFLISLPTFIRLLRPGFFSMQDDVQAFRLYEFDQCVRDWQFPCRWIPDGGAGYGYPLFNFYPPLPYILGEAFHLLGISVLDSTKLLFVAGFIISSFSIYFLMKEISQREIVGLISSVFYLYAPYRAVDSYVRGALNEFLALSIAPILLLGIYLIFKNRKTGLILTVVSLTSIILTHMLTIFMLIPLLGIWTCYWFYKSNDIKTGKYLVIGFVLSTCLSAFFWLPAISESKFTTLETITQGYFDYRGHFVTLAQLFLSRFWGYGASVFGEEDGMSFQIGIVHLTLILIAIGYSLLYKRNRPILLFVIIGIFYLYLTHNKSTPIWLAIKPLAYLQFPWRFLGPAILAFTIAIAAFNKLKTIVLIIMLTIIVVANYKYFKEDIWFSTLTDGQKLSSQEITKQNISGLKDYWPKFGTDFPVEQAPKSIKFISGIGEQNILTKNSNRLYSDITAENESLIEFPIVYFPGWKAYLNNLKTPIYTSNNLGLVRLTVPKGIHKISLNFEDTPIRTIANYISAISAVITYTFFKNHKQTHV